MKPFLGFAQFNGTRTLLSQFVEVFISPEHDSPIFAGLRSTVVSSRPHGQGVADH
jgi:hypothetical protein